MSQAIAQGVSRADLDHATATIRKGSKSFAAAARLFAPEVRADAVLLYAWCRYCDDVIDGQSLGFARPGATAGAEDALAALRQETAAALTGTARDPVFAAFGSVMRRHGIPETYAYDHLDGFAMDVAGRAYVTFEDTLRYCYGVAGVIGILMAYLMGVRDPATLDRARDLGLAFQLTNIARDLVEDAEAGRVYLPAEWLAEAGVPGSELAERRHRVALAGLAKRLVASAEPYYASAAIGIQALPFRSAWAISTARRVYRAIGLAVVRRGPAAWDSRVSTSTPQKLLHVALGGGEAVLSAGTLRGRRAA